MLRSFISAVLLLLASQTAATAVPEGLERGLDYSKFQNGAPKVYSHKCGKIKTKAPSNWFARSNCNKNSMILNVSPNNYESLVRTDIPYLIIELRKDEPVSFKSFTKNCKSEHPDNGKFNTSMFSKCSKNNENWGILTQSGIAGRTKGVTYYYGLIFQERITKLESLSKYNQNLKYIIGW